jgi:anti-sigma regulatory factor (Ser/Thr protein kinase)/CheY-like chemotaxis protein
VRELLVIGPSFPWQELRLSPDDWPDCHVTEIDRESLAILHLATRAADVVLLSPTTSAADALRLAAEARRLQPGVRVVVFAADLTRADVIAALKNEVFGCFTVPADPAELRQAISEALAANGWENGIRVESAVPHWIALRVSCRRVTAERLTHFMDEMAGDLPDSERYQLITAFREVLLNAMEHGAGFDPDKVVDVHAVRTQRTLVYYFKDPGPGFNVNQPTMVASEQDPLSHLELREAAGKRAGGFGLLLTGKLVDELYFNERGNEVILVKHLDDQEAGARDQESETSLPT